jgi:hypothetical protein
VLSDMVRCSVFCVAVAVVKGVESEFKAIMLPTPTAAAVSQKLSSISSNAVLSQ